MQLEAEMRRIPGVGELRFHMANESRTVLGFRQCFVLRRKRAFRVEAISSIPAFDRNAPLVRWIEGVAKRIEKEGKSASTQSFEIGKFVDNGSIDAKEYNFPHFLWLPLMTPKGKVFAAMLVAREKPWPEASIPLAERTAEAYAHSWFGLSGRSLERRSLSKSAVFFPLAALTAAALWLIHVPLTVLAPVEVQGRDPTVVTSPLDGVVEELLVSANSFVSQGDLLAVLADDELRDQVTVADRNVHVSRARLEQLQQDAFSDRNSARQIAMAEAEIDLARTELEIAQSRFQRTRIFAANDGVAVLDDADAWAGRPVRLGERILEIADPAKVELNISLPLGESIVLSEGARVRVFLDSDPLNPLDAVLTKGSYQASSQSDGRLAFELTARLEEEAGALPRMGARGTAQIFGARHSLGFVIFRKPISWLRQRFGL